MCVCVCVCVLAYRMVGLANSTYQQALSRGLTQSQAWNISTVDWTVAAKVQWKTLCSIQDVAFQHVRVVG